MPTAAIIGTNWGARMHVPALTAAGFDVKLLCGRDAERTRLARDEYAPSALISTDFREALAGPFDLVVSAVPWQLHAQLYEMALDSRTGALLLEHPIASTSRHARSVIRDSSTRSAYSFANFPAPFIPCITALFDHLAGYTSVDFVDHTFVYPRSEEQDWLPLISSHSLALACLLFRLAEVEKSDIRNAHMHHSEETPGWSWPLGEGSGRDRSTSLVADSLSGTIRLVAGGVYRFFFGYGESDEFHEKMDVASGGHTLRYETRLQRDDEHSPWKASPLIVDGRECVAPTSSTELSSSTDSWFAAHVSQAAEIRRAIEGHQPSKLLSSLSRAIESQELLERLLIQAGVTEVLMT